MSDCKNLICLASKESDSRRLIDFDPNTAKKKTVFPIPTWSSNNNSKDSFPYYISSSSLLPQKPKYTTMVKKMRPDHQTYQIVSPISITSLEYDILEPDAPITDAFTESVQAVEKILNYKFEDKSLIEAALTHPSFANSTSYQRLEFIGDAALGLMLANFVFVTYDHLDPGQLSLLRSANISTEKLARVAVNHSLFGFVRHNAPALHLKVDEFAEEIRNEGDEILAFGGSVKAPKVLADIVESIAAAVYVDCKFNLVRLWEIFGHMLEPLVTLENIQQQPVTMLYELCQKLGKKLDFTHLRNGEKNVTNVHVDGKMMSSASAEQKETSKLSAAKEALGMMMNPNSSMESTGSAQFAREMPEIQEAKRKLVEHCHKNGSMKPIYSIVRQEGPAHDTRFICSVQIEISGSKNEISGNPKTKVKEAENSAASMMLHVLKDA